MRKTNANKLIVNQSCIDALASIFLLSSHFTGSWLNLHNFVTLCALCLMVVSTYNLVFLNIDRYISVVHPVWHHTRYDKNKVLGMISSAWLLGFLIACCTRLPWEFSEFNCKSRYIPETGSYFSEVWCISFFAITFIAYFILPVFIIAFCYSGIIRVLRKRSRSPSLQSENAEFAVVQTESREYNRWYKAEKHCIKTVFIISMCFILCWLPCMVVIVPLSMDLSLLIDPKIENDVSISPMSSNMTHFCCVNPYTSVEIHSLVLVAWQVNCCINPVIYSFQYKQFQTAASHFFGKSNMKNWYRPVQTGHDWWHLPLWCNMLSVNTKPYNR